MRGSVRVDDLVPEPEPDARFQYDVGQARLRKDDGLAIGIFPSRILRRNEDLLNEVGREADLEERADEFAERALESDVDVEAVGEFILCAFEADEERIELGGEIVIEPEPKSIGNE